MKKTTAGRKVNNVKRRLVSALLLAAVTLTATGSVWESPAETVQVTMDKAAAEALLRVLQTALK